MLFLLFTSVLLPLAISQTCSDAGIGLCVGDVCPTDFTCIDKGLSTETCCDNTKIVTVTTAAPTTVPPTTAAPSSSCVDLLNPNTGVSDCPQRTSYCQDSVYYDLMTQQCPKTCGRCTGGGGGTGTGGSGGSNCADKLNPKTGVSDCPQRTSYCSNQVYFDLMTDQCPHTCGRCSISAGPTGGTSGGCVDLINPSTGQSDCPGMASYCSNQVYYNLMTTQCPLTCGRCTTSSGSSGSGGTSGTSGTSGGCVDKLNPLTGISDCPSRVSYCNDQTYSSLMTDQCPLTCGRCSG